MYKKELRYRFFIWLYGVHSMESIAWCQGSKNLFVPRQAKLPVKHVNFGKFSSKFYISHFEKNTLFLIHRALPVCKEQKMTSVWITYTTIPPTLEAIPLWSFFLAVPYRRTDLTTNGGQYSTGPHGHMERSSQVSQQYCWQPEIVWNIMSCGSVL